MSLNLTTIEAVRAYMSQDGRCPGELIAVAEQEGGYISHTYKVTTTEGEFFLKHTADHKKGTSETVNDMDNLFDEAAAYGVLSAYMSPKLLPNVLFYDDANRSLLLTDALPGATTTLKDIVHEPRWPLDVATAVGYHIGKLHGDAAPDQPTIRPLERETRHYKGLVAWLTSDLSFNSPITQELIEAKARAMTGGRKTLLIGDLAPRNILAKDADIAVVDLARATLGSPAFDIGYFVGQLLLNAIEFGQLAQANRFLKHFRNAYASGISDSRSALDLSPDAIFEESKVFAAGWMHRRTFQPSQPEDIPEHELRTVEDYISELAAQESFGY